MNSPLDTPTPPKKVSNLRQSITMTNSSIFASIFGSITSKPSAYGIVWLCIIPQLIMAFVLGFVLDDYTEIGQGMISVYVMLVVVGVLVEMAYLFTIADNYNNITNKKW